MLKKPLLLAVLLFISSCSSYGLNNLFGQNKTNQHRNPDMQYLEDDHLPPQRKPTHRNEAPYVEARHPYPAQEQYHEDDEDDVEHDYEEEDDDGYDNRPVQRDRCAFYGLTPGTAAHQDCQKQLYKQQHKQRYYR